MVCSLACSMPRFGLRVDNLYDAGFQAWSAALLERQASCAAQSAAGTSEKLSATAPRHVFINQVLVAEAYFQLVRMDVDIHHVGRHIQCSVRRSGNARWSRAHVHPSSSACVKKLTADCAPVDDKGLAALGWTAPASPTPTNPLTRHTAPSDCTGIIALAVSRAVQTEQRHCANPRCRSWHKPVCRCESAERRRPDAPESGACNHFGDLRRLPSIGFFKKFRVGQACCKTVRCATMVVPCGLAASVIPLISPPSLTARVPAFLVRCSAWSASAWTRRQWMPAPHRGTRAYEAQTNHPIW